MVVALGCLCFNLMLYLSLQVVVSLFCLFCLTLYFCLQVMVALLRLLFLSYIVFLSQCCGCFTSSFVFFWYCIFVFRLWLLYVVFCFCLTLYFCLQVVVALICLLFMSHVVFLSSGGGWLTIMKRENGDVDFYRGWQEYKIGFGAVSKEFWLGLSCFVLFFNSKWLWYNGFFLFSCGHTTLYPSIRPSVRPSVCQSVGP